VNTKTVDESMDLKGRKATRGIRDMREFASFTKMDPLCADHAASHSQIPRAYEMQPRENKFIHHVRPTHTIVLVIQADRSHTQRTRHKANQQGHNNQQESRP
jgi:hypothetical protein